MLFVGYEIALKAYRLWDPKACKIVVSANVKFDKSVLLNRPTPPPVPAPARPIPSSSSFSNPLFPPSKPQPTVEAPWFFDDDEELKPKSSLQNPDKGKQQADCPSPPPPAPSSPPADDHILADEPANDPPVNPSPPPSRPPSPQNPPESPTTSPPSTPPDQGTPVVP